VATLGRQGEGIPVLGRGGGRDSHGATRLATDAGCSPSKGRLALASLCGVSIGMTPLVVLVEWLRAGEETWIL
jgi:hypothetical protein